MATKNRTKKPTEVPVPGKVLVQRPKDWVKCLDASLLNQSSPRHVGLILFRAP